MRRLADLLAAAVLVLLAVAFVVQWLWFPVGMSAFDTYMYYQPNMLYAVQRLAAGGSGLLWNAWQNCGQPAFGITSTGFLYPFNALYLILPPDVALRVIVVLNFAVAGIGAYAWGRSLSLDRAAALCCAFAFQLNGATIHLNTWGPQMGGPWVWLPVAMACCERLLRAPTPRLAVGLGLALALPLLPGFPQVVFFAYQLIALRVLYELVTAPAARSWRTVGLLGLGLALAPLLVAVQLLPGLEMMALSVRGAPLSAAEMEPGGAHGLTRLLTQITGRLDLFNPIIIVPAVAAGAWWCRASTRRVGGFYLLAGLLYFLLALGSTTPLFELYRGLPLGSLFREPGRFMWMTGLCFAALTGLGAQALIEPATTGWRRIAAPLSALASLVALALILPRGLLPMEWMLGVLVLVAGVAVARQPRAVGAATVAVPLALALGTILFRPAFSPAPAEGARRPPWGPLAVRNMTPKHLVDGGVIDQHADQLRQLAAQLTPQERVYIANRHTDYALMPKSAALFGLPATIDYEPQAGRRYADYYIFMRKGEPLRSLTQFYVPALGVQRFQRRLLDLAAGRYLIAEASTEGPEHYGLPPLVPLAAPAGALRLYENPSALPRARWVPRAEVVADPPALLQRLAAGRDDPRAVLLLEQPPSSGFLGAPTASGAAATATFTRNDPEHLVLRVAAPAPGFLLLADQHFPGWTATVNGASAPILRANYVFRAVEVPAGESVVTFDYRPASLRLGAAISGLTVAGLLAWAVWQRRRGRVVVMSPLIVIPSPPGRGRG
jgi:hypothetical protein